MKLQAVKFGNLKMLASIDLRLQSYALKCRFSGGSDRIDFLASTAPQFLVPDKCLTPFSKALNSLYLNLKDKGP